MLAPTASFDAKLQSSYFTLDNIAENAQYVVMRHVVSGYSLGALLLCSFTGRAQTPIARPAFEVASIKPNPNCAGGRGGNAPPEPGRLRVTCLPASALIEVAYGTFADGASRNPQQFRILGGPGWMDSDTFDITARALDNAAVAQMYGPMMQMLLEDRFRLRIHKEYKESPVYLLTEGKSGPRLKPTTEGSCAPIDLSRPQQPERGQVVCGAASIHGNDAMMLIDAHGVKLDVFGGRMLANSLDRPVIDKTGLTGMFDIHLEFSNDARNSESSSAPSIFTAVQEQLGLKLSPGTAPVEVLIVDHIEKPTEN
jgi:uncharacterized protein (TIGR03435 family)